MPFEGFSDETFHFLADLTANNEKPWFEANRKRYEAHYLGPALAFIDDIGPRMQSELPGEVKFEARVNGSLFRINRDVRFSKDKTPYKNHIDMWFWQGERKGWDSPGYFLRLLPDQLLLGSGMHGFAKEGLEPYRNAVVAEDTGRALEAVAAKVTGAGPYTIGGESRKTVPRGYDGQHPRAHYLLFEGLTGGLEGPIPAEVAEPAFIDFCMAHFKALSPINDWLAEVFGPK